ncbi:MAG: VOC family protein [Leptospiraceae bacterium]|nr:VOC family protein [Leptospiraceae bacterium]
MIIVEGINHISLPVTNLKASTQFYSDLFDFEVIDDSSKEYVYMTFDPIQVKLIKVDKLEQTYKFPVVSFAMDVDDFTEAIEEIEEKGIKIEKGPESTDTGESIVIKDPDGNLIELYYQG